MAWRRLGDKSLSEPMMVSLLTYICATRPQWVNWEMSLASWPSFFVGLNVSTGTYTMVSVHFGSFLIYGDWCYCRTFSYSLNGFRYKPIQFYHAQCFKHSIYIPRIYISRYLHFLKEVVKNIDDVYEQTEHCRNEIIGLVAFFLKKTPNKQMLS